VRQKISITNRLRYITKEKYEIYNRMLSNDKFTILFTFDEMDYVKTNYKIKCNNCNHEFYRYFDDFLLQFKCPNCNIGSSIENKIKELLDSNNINYIINNRTIISPYELDFYLPEYNIAIECHGLYWHSETILQNRNIYARTYHLLKHDLCKSEGIQLLQFFEDEIVNRFDIISNIILAKCNKLKMLCGARKCEIREITNSQSNHILKYNHIHNSSNSKFQIGAYYKNELVAVMTFKDYAISRSNNGNMELDRFCTINGYYIPGIASRLFKYFINNNENCNISTYADLRFSNGNLYDKLGFKFIHQSKPSYSYIINKERKHRFTYRKSILKTKLLKFDETVTGYQNMINNGYDRIWDCGHLKYEYKKD
jgi:very-short-patch-repair endonuclease